MSSAAVTGNAALLPQTELELSIKGMTCAACAARVEKKLSAVDGVEASVNFATGKAAVTAPPSVSVPGRAGGGVRAGCSAGDLHQALPGAGGLPQCGHRAARQDRDPHDRSDGRRRGSACGWYRP